MATTPTVPTTSPSAPAASSTSTAASSTPAASSSPSSTAASTSSATSTPSLEVQLQQRIQAGFEKGGSATSGAPEAGAASEGEAGAPADLSTEPGQAATLEADPTAETSDQGDTADGFDWDIPTGTGPKELAEKIATNPELKAAIDANPEIRDMLFANSRLAAREKEYAELFGSPSEAKVVAESHQQFANLRSLMGEVKIGDAKSTQGVINAMLEQGALRDDNGDLIRNQDGTLQTDGTVGTFLRNFFEMRLSLLEQKAKQSGDNETLAALDTIMERAGFRTPSSADEDGLSDELRAERDRIQQERQQLDERKATERQEAQKRHDTAVFSQIDTSLDKSITSLLDRATGLTPFSRSKVEADLRAGLKKAVGTNPSYQMELDRIERMPIGRNREQKHIATATRYIQDHLIRVAAPILQEAGVTIGKQNATRDAAQAARAEAARSEIRGTNAPVHQQQTPQDAAARNAQIKAELSKQLGREPSLEEMLAAKIRSGSKRTAA